MTPSEAGRLALVVVVSWVALSALGAAIVAAWVALT